MTKEETKPDYVELGFAKIESDLRELMDALAVVLEDLGHADLAGHLPWRSDKEPAGETPPRLGLAYSVAFQLLNMVEEQAAASMRKVREMHEGLGAEHGLWGSQLARLKAAGIDAHTIAEQLERVRVEPVLTAHPTEAKRLAVLGHHRTLFALLEELGEPGLTDAMKRTVRSELRATLECLWRTGEILLEKPTLTDERRNVLHYLRDVFPAVLPLLDERLNSAWVDAGLPREELKVLPRVRFGTWVGGDRDGHPGVTAEVTAETLERLRANALVVQHRALSALAESLTLTAWMQPPPKELTVLSDSLKAKLGARAQPILSERRDEPWRQAVEMMVARLPVEVTPGRLAQLRDGEDYYAHSAELRADLEQLEASLKAVGADRLVARDVLPAQRTAEVFGFHLAQLDIRQNSAFHVRALAQLMGAAGIDGSQWEDWSETERLRFLEKELGSPRPFLHPSASAGPEADAVLGCYRVLASHIERHGANGLGSLIVSMTRRLSDLLVVYILAREAGLLRAFPEGMVCLLPVVPLFETGDDLHRGPDIVQQFLELPVTRASIAFHAKRAGRPDNLQQQVMVGYSDSNKDAGIFASQWALRRAQSRLAAATRVSGVAVRFFHGRGGTVSRGAGPMHRFLDALPHGSLCGDIRLTEQGETIAQKFGNLPTALYNLELLVAGVAAATVLHSGAPEPEHPLAPIAQRLSEESERAYRKLVEAEGFLTFYRQATPIDALEHARIGSRPSRRTGQATLADLRAIPWVFSWNQSRFYVPGWYGVGSALAALAPEERARLGSEIRSWPFLHYVLTNVEASIASADADLMAAYAGLVEDAALRERFLGLLQDEYQRTTAMLAEVRGRSMAERRPRMLRTLRLRADALRVLHHQQIALLRKWRKLRVTGADAAAEAMLPELLLSINAIASGLRTTG
jgi:phosphoenolpyruvate carboxylase